MGDIMKGYFQDDSYFEKINTEKKAYYLGFLYADGCVSVLSDNNKSIILLLHPDDGYILKEFLKDIRSNRPVYVNKRGYVFITIKSVKMADDLIRFGCLPRKSLILKFPDEGIVPKGLQNHFIRGYMDGDGCISTHMTKRKRKTQTFVCEIKFIGTYDMLNGIKKYFDSDKNVLINKHSPKSCQISFAGRKYRNAVDLLYKNASVYLKRKKNKWDEFVEYMNRIDKSYQDKVCRRIVKLSKYGDYIGTYKHKELRNEFNIRFILKCCEQAGKRPYKKFIWIYEDEYKKFLKSNIDIKTKLGCKEEDINKKPKVIKSVEQYDLNKKLIKTWETPKAAAEYYTTTSKAIRKVCTGERKTCCNFIWKYTKELKNNKNKVVIQYDKNGNLIREWSSLREVAIFYDVTFQAIERAINGRYKTCCGFVWTYSDKSL